MFNFSLRAHYKVLISPFKIYIMQRPLLRRGLETWLGIAEQQLQG